MYNVKKTNDPILRKFSDWQTDGQTDSETEKSDFIRRCPTNFESPICFDYTQGLKFKHFS